MKLDSSWRALLWEELYVGGRIVAVMLGVCVLIAFSAGVFFTKPPVDWREVDIFCYLVAYMVSVLLLLQVTNSGEMHINIPRRILSLPVDTSMIVSISLVVRTVLLILFTIFSRIIVGLILSFFVGDYGNYLYIEIFRRLFPLEFQFYVPLVFPTLINTIAYITLQFACWLFVLSPFAVVAIVAIIFLGILVFSIGGKAILISKLLSIFFGYYPYLGLTTTNEVSLSAGQCILILGVLVLYVAFIWFLSVEVVSRLRIGGGGYSISAFSLKLSSVWNRLFPGMIMDRFSSSKTAQLWFEIGNNSLIIPVWTLIFFILLNVIYVLVIFTLNLMGSAPYRYSFSPTISVMAFPYIALVLSGVVWHLKVTRKMKRDFRSGVFQLSYVPITRKERIYIHWLAGNINLIITLLVIWMIEFAYLCWLFKMHVLIPPFFEGMTGVNFQVPFPDLGAFFFPLLISTLGLTTLIGLIVWLIMFNPPGLLVLALLVLCYLSLPSYWGSIGGIIGNSSSVLYQLFNIRNWLPVSMVSVVFLLIYIYYIALFIAYLYIASHSNVLRRREIVFLILIFLAIFVFTTAWYMWGGVSSILLIGTYLFISAIFTTAWARMVLLAYGFQWRNYLKNRNFSCAGGEVGEENISYLSVGYLVPLVFAILVAISNLDTGINERVVAYLKKNSLPLSLKEVNDKYHSVSQNDTLCKRYFDLIPVYKMVMKEETEYIERFCENVSTESMSYEDKSCLKRVLTNYYSENDTTKPIPHIVYTGCKGLIENVDKELIEELEKIADSKLEGGSYPIDLTRGFSVELPHLANLRSFVRVLGLKSIINAIDGDYEGMLRALRACASIYNSLENEPVYISQLVRIALFGTVYKCVEWIINHQELPNDVLLRLGEVIDSFSIPLEKRSIFGPALHTELLTFLSYSSMSHGDWMLLENNYSGAGKGYSWQMQILNIWFPVIKIYYTSDVEQMVGVNMYTTLGNILKESSQAERFDIPTKVFLDMYINRVFEKSDNSLFASTPPYWFYPMLRIVFPGLSRAVDAELRHYVFINLAKTAIAIERFRINKGRLPEDLNELVPEYLSVVPKDPWKDGETIKYVKGDDFSYRIYSIGMDREDDGGIDKDVKKGIKKVGTEEDFVFSVLTLGIRRAQDVSTEISLSELCR